MEPMNETVTFRAAGVGAVDETAAGMIYRKIRRDILGGRLTANERLKVSALAKRYETSTNPVREALQQLRGEGLVVMAPNRGARVRVIDEDFVRDIYEMEVLIEPYLVRWFVGQCSQTDIARLEALQDEMEALNFTDLGRQSTLDSEFHWLTYERHYNRHALDLWWRHREILRIINRDQDVSMRRRRDVIVQHRALIAAFRDQDEERAARVLADHVRGSGEHIVNRMRAERINPRT